jgi:hypothetical protein
MSDISSNQGNLFEQAATARANALKAVADSTDEGWRIEALEAVRRTALRLPSFISDDIWESGLEQTREDRALGPVMLKAARIGYCRKTDRVRPSVRSHLSGKPVWESLICQDANAEPGDQRLGA